MRRETVVRNHIVFIGTDNRINNELFQALCETLSCGSQSFDLITYRMKRLFAERVKENV